MALNSNRAKRDHVRDFKVEQIFLNLNQCLIIDSQKGTNCVEGRVPCVEILINAIRVKGFNLSPVPFSRFIHMCLVYEDKLINHKVVYVLCV